uniref:Uncharacterized protein n=1 Tax=Parastrongyloides trichosuri TaxID=131310 RepID=A0A0N5A482_PARTI
MDNKNEDGETFDDNDIIFKRKGSIKNLVRKSVTVQQKAVKRIMSLKQRKNIFFQDEYWKKRNEVYKLYHSRESLEELHICPYIKELNMYLFRHRGSAPEILSKTKTISKPCSSLDFNNILYEHQNCHHFGEFFTII